MKSARGAAIIVAMLVAALAATVAVALAGDQRRWLADVPTRRDQVQAQSLALAGVQWARQVLEDDARAGSVDHRAEIWAYPLPPTPIAMPGTAALLAAVQPASTRALYFVAKGDGSSHFSTSLDEHNRAVNRYQRGQSQ